MHIEEAQANELGSIPDRSNGREMQTQIDKAIGNTVTEKIAMDSSGFSYLSKIVRSRICKFGKASSNCTCCNP